MSVTAKQEAEDPRLLAAMELLRRVGAGSLEIRYSEPEHAGSPTVWIAVIELRPGHPAGPHVPPQVAAGLTPYGAVRALAEQLIDGGQCQHCGRITAFYDDPADDPIPGACAYQYDPELRTYRRSCEGETADA